MRRPKILCLGDFHLGAKPRRVPSGIDPREVSVASAWRRAVDLALREEVGLVLLSGDLVDRANRYFEAFGPFGKQLRRLAEAGAHVCAVAGNHDFDVLSRLAEGVGGEHFHLLGDRGRWERFTWRDADGRAVAHVDGWSFPAQDVEDDPLAGYDLEAPKEPGPRLGLLHGDLDASPSTNAPLTRAGLEACAGGAFDAWVLGHLHQPRVAELAGGRWALYPGSLQPRDWTEEGEHGAWIVEVADGRLGSPEMVPLATVRWETLEVDLTGAADRDEVSSRGAVELQSAADELAASGPGAPEWLLLRVELTGRTAVSRAAVEEIARRMVEDAELAAGDARLRVAEARVDTRPAIDLADLARGDGPPALLAGLLLALDRPDRNTGGSAGGDPALRDLLARAGRKIDEVHRLRPYAALGDDPAGPEARREHVAAAAWSLLEAFLARKPGAARGGEGAP